MEIDYKAIGQRIRIARIRLGRTQEAIADRINVTPAHMSNIETGKTKLSLPTLIGIANALSVSADALLCDNVKDSSVVFEEELEELLSDCDEYETRLLVDLLKACKETIRRNRQTADRLES